MAFWQCKACKGPPIEGDDREKPWVGPCPHCGRYRDAKRIDAANSSKQKGRSTFANTAEVKTEYVSTGIEGLDYVLSGGLVAGSPILFGGFRGTGKSTLLVLCAEALSKRRKVVYASSEQSEQAVTQIAHRIGANSDNVVVLGNQGVIQDTLEKVRQERPFLVIYDSLQKFTSNLSAGTPGSSSQGTAVASAIKADCRKTNRCAIIVNQMARSGELKGGLDVEHDVDTVMVFAYPKDDDEDAPGNEGDGIRMLIVDKNRNGTENLKSYWHMTKTGLLEHVPPKSKSSIIDIGSRRSRYSKQKDEGP